ncbi:posphoenolpyruvate synthetase regulatory kinase/phosphorylase PpsR [Endozoicomonadaceae bacterium StTr2]
MQRRVFFISDGTGITAESFGQSLLAQFDHIEVSHQTLPYIDTPEKALKVVEDLAKAKVDGHRPLVFSTIINEEVSRIIQSADAKMFDIFQSFMPGVEAEFEQHAIHAVGKKRAIDSDNNRYNKRIEAVHFALDNDDGARTRYYDNADIIIVGVSRSGKTPTCLYMGLQFGIHAANYPITEDDLDMSALPAALKPYKHKLFGLTIDPARLTNIRNERRPNSRYASMRQCSREVSEVEMLYQRERIPFINTTHYSVEEISTRIMVQAGIERRLK